MAVRFDDRLTTVLGHPASTPHDRAIRWRQLVELAARAPTTSDPDLLRQALDEVRAGIGSVDERVRVAAALAIANQPLAPDLVAVFASDKLAVAAPVLASARLTASEWKHVASASSVECKAFISAIRMEQPEPAPAERERVAEPAAEDPPHIPSISEVVARIERLRQARENGETPAPARTEVESPRLFRWECNDVGEIDWVEGAPRGPLVGRSIAQPTIGRAVDPMIQRAFQSRAPFHEASLDLPEGAAVGGIWKISGIPAFEPSSGRFAGYRGIAERPADEGRGAAAGSSAHSLRELAHEIRTPLNAIIGFAEMITGQYLGPAESSYRERAEQIVGQARLLLAAVEDLDLAAKLHSHPHGQAQVHVGQLVEGLIAAIREEAAERGVEVDASRTTGDLRAAVDAEVAERLVRRLCSAAIASAVEGERLRLSVDSDGSHCMVSVSRPESLDAADLRPEMNRRADDPASVPLRLVMSLARTAGGELDATDDRLVLRLPKAAVAPDPPGNYRDWRGL